MGRQAYVQKGQRINIDNEFFISPLITPLMLVVKP
jgi:hypothetical protein